MSVIRIVRSAHSCPRSASLLAAVATFAAMLTSAPARADDYDAAIKDIQSTMGGVPSFVKQFPKAVCPGRGQRSRPSSSATKRRCRRR